MRLSRRTKTDDLNDNDRAVHKQDVKEEYYVIFNARKKKLLVPKKGPFPDGDHSVLRVADANIRKKLLGLPEGLDTSKDFVYFVGTWVKNTRLNRNQIADKKKEIADVEAQLKQRQRALKQAEKELNPLDAEEKKDAEKKREAQNAKSKKETRQTRQTDVPEKTDKEKTFVDNLENMTKKVEYARLNVKLKEDDLADVRKDLEDGYPVLEHHIKEIPGYTKKSPCSCTDEYECGKERHYCGNVDPEKHPGYVLMSVSKLENAMNEQKRKTDRKTAKKVEGAMKKHDKAENEAAKKKKAPDEAAAKKAADEAAKKKKAKDEAAKKKKAPDEAAAKKAADEAAAKKAKDEKKGKTKDKKGKTKKKKDKDKKGSKGKT